METPKLPQDKSQKPRRERPKPVKLSEAAAARRDRETSPRARSHVRALAGSEAVEQRAPSQVSATAILAAFFFVLSIYRISIASP